jgi:hypothetical protein
MCDIDRVNAVFRKAKRWGITEYIYYAEDFIEIAQLKLFKHFICNNTHCLYQLLPNKRDCNYDLHTEDTSTNFQIIKPHQKSVYC